MLRKNLIPVVTGVAALAISACDRPVEGAGETVGNIAPAESAASQIACQDPETGELIQPGPGVDCRVPEEAKALEEPVVKELEGGGTSVELKGRFDKNQEAPTSSNRMAVIDPKTGELVTSRPSDPQAAIRYDRSVARAKAILERQSKTTSLEPVYREALPNGGVRVHLQGRFQVPLVAELSEDGQVHLRHQQQ